MGVSHTWWYPQWMAKKHLLKWMINWGTPMT